MQHSGSLTMMAFALWSRLDHPMAEMYCACSFRRCAHSGHLRRCNRLTRRHRCSTGDACMLPVGSAWLWASSVPPGDCLGRRCWGYSAVFMQLLGAHGWGAMSCDANWTIGAHVTLMTWNVESSVQIAQGRALMGGKAVIENA